MPPRATPQMVREAITEEEAEGLTDQRLMIPLRLASTLVDRLYAQDVGEAPEMLEILLAAHYATESNPSISQERYAEGSVGYHRPEGIESDLMRTVYGRQALQFDARLHDLGKERPIFEVF